MDTSSDPGMWKPLKKASKTRRETDDTVAELWTRESPGHATRNDGFLTLQR